MDYQYKVIVSNRTVYKEFEIAAGVENVKLGTTSSCEFRLNPETFFSEIEIEFTACSDEWNIDCADQLYFSKGDMRKLYSMEISHGDIIAVCYSNTGKEFSRRSLPYLRLRDRTPWQDLYDCSTCFVRLRMDWTAEVVLLPTNAASSRK